MSSPSVADPTFPPGEALGASPDQLHAVFDDEREWSSFGQPLPSPPSAGTAPVWESFVLLSGMYCAACALNIEEALRAVPGVLEVQVSAATQRARVTWQPEQVRPSQWVKAVERAGYGVLPAVDALAREHRLREGRTALWRWLVAGFCMMQVMMYAWPAYTAQPGELSQEMEQLLRWASWVLSLPVICFSCGPFFAAAWRDVRRRQVSMELPVALGMGLTFITSTLGTFDPSGPFGHEVYYDSLTMFVFFLLTGRWLEVKLRDRTAGALEGLLHRLPESIERLDEIGGWVRVPVRSVQPGDVLRVLSGEVFPADGEIQQGQTMVDEALLTGESTPVLRGVGDRIISGSHNLGAVVQVLVSAVGASTRLGEMIALMESAALEKPRLAQLADRLAKPFLVGVLVAASVALIWWGAQDIAYATMVAVAVLIVTCPCALSLATPVAMLTTAGTLARQGLLVRHLQALETLSSVDTVVFDKTGTLTSEGMLLESVIPLSEASEWDEDALKAIALLLAQQSLHPVSKALADALHELPPVEWSVVELHEVAGAGLLAECVGPDGRQVRWRLGSAAHTGAVTQAQAFSGPQLYLGVDCAERGKLALMHFSFRERLREDAAHTVQFLQSQGLNVWLLSGDQHAQVAQVAEDLSIPQWRGECSPQSKLEVLRQLQAKGHTVAMVGDGINDGPVLAGANVSFAFGASAAITQSCADFVVLGSQISMVAHVWLQARQTLRIIRQNLAWAMAYNVSGVPLAFAGYMPPWLAGLGMALSSLLVVLNAARLIQHVPGPLSLHSSGSSTNAQAQPVPAITA